MLNAALTLRGEHPIVAEVDWLPEPRLILVSRDLDTTFEPCLAGEVLAYANPADPFALHKAALVLARRRAAGHRSRATAGRSAAGTAAACA